MDIAKGRAPDMKRRKQSSDIQMGKSLMKISDGQKQTSLSSESTKKKSEEKSFVITIPHVPVPWAAATITKTGAFDIRRNQKRAAIIHVKSQWKQKPIQCAVRVDVLCVLPVPESASKKRKALMEMGYIHAKTKPDRTNLAKLYEDVLESAGVLENDSLIVTGVVGKRYGRDPCVIMTITKLEDEHD